MRSPIGKTEGATATTTTTNNNDDNDNQQTDMIENANANANANAFSKPERICVPRAGANGDKPTRIVLQVPDHNAAALWGEWNAAKEYAREVAFVRKCTDEVPLRLPQVLGVWDDGGEFCTNAFEVVC